MTCLIFILTVHYAILLVLPVHFNHFVLLYKRVVFTSTSTSDTYAKERTCPMNDRKRQVLRTAPRLFIENGFSMTSVQHIIDEAQLSKGTFYNYFKSKSDCLLAILHGDYDEATVV